MSTKTVLMAVTLNGFHGFETHRCKVEVTPNPEYVEDRLERTYWGQSNKYYGRIAESAADKFVCRISDCCCGEGIDTTFPLEDWEIANKQVEIPGNYPQR